jgi:hypothetical protein
VAQNEFVFRRVPGIPEGVSCLPDRTLYQTPEWVQFVAASQSAEPVYGELRSGDDVVGYVTGLVITRFGVRIFGSPFPGWGTASMGFNVMPHVPRWRALEAVSSFAFADLRCAHVEVIDPLLTPADGAHAGARFSFVVTYETSLDRAEDEIWAAMKSSCRRAIRKAEKSGVVVEEVDPVRERAGAFAHEYYEQLREVFARRDLVPTYPVERVQTLIDHLAPADRILLLRALDPEGHSVATNISVGMSERAEFWGGASFAAGHHLRPNNALHWYAMRHWKGLGAAVYDWGGGGRYKERYGAERVYRPRFYFSRYPGLPVLRDIAHRAARTHRRVAKLAERVRLGLVAPALTDVCALAERFCLS